MTTKDEASNITTAPTSANLPPLSEMIMTSIEMLNDKSGSEKSTIQSHIESNYSSLSPDFSESLSTHLEEMKQNGQLVMVNDKYKKPESEPEAVVAPLRRGRGRPPKPKPVMPSGYDILPARPRGRPPKARDPSAPAPPPKPAVSSGRKRGRPPKANKAPKPEGVVAPSGERRGRGRPPKVRPPVVVPVGY